MQCEDSRASHVRLLELSVKIVGGFFVLAE